MVILLQINKPTFEKSEKLEKKKTSQNLVKIFTENCSFVKKSLSRFFLNCPGGNST